MNYEEDCEGPTLLHCACQHGDLIFALFLLSDPSTDLLARDFEGKTPFHLACEYGRYDIVRLMGDRFRSVDQLVDNRGRTPLFDACLTKGNLDVVRLLLELGADPRKLDCVRATPFVAAFSNEDVEVVKLFLDHGLDVNEDDGKGYKLLHNAAAIGSANVARFLLDQGADIEAKGVNDDVRPLHIASMYASVENVETARLFLDRGADVNAQVNDGSTALHIACAKGCHNGARLLLDRGANVEARTTTTNETPLDNACKYRQLELVWLLVSRCPWLILNELATN